MGSSDHFREGLRDGSGAGYSLGFPLSSRDQVNLACSQPGLAKSGEDLLEEIPSQEGTANAGSLTGSQEGI